jgi:hypothetical protein
MMSSVIPARLQFQCGHAALVTLPRVKGETATQRNDRVAREKSAALARQCDFCAPPVEVVLNGNHIATADAVVAEPIATLAVVVAAEPEAEPEPEAAPEVVVQAEPEPEIAVVEAELAVIEPEIVVVEPETLVAVLEPVVEAVEAPEVVVEAIVVVKPVVATNGHTTKSAPTRQTRKRLTTVNTTTGHTFVVEYRDERVLRAVDIHDALRQLETLGDAQVTALTREN